MARHRVGIVIPALNEVETIGAIVANASIYGCVIVVDDGSIDNTGDLAAFSGATVVTHNTNFGYDVALNSGFAKANEMGCDVVISMDADGQHDPSLLLSFIRMLDEGADLVIGIRDNRQRLAEHIFAWISSIKWGVSDPLCGMKAYRISLYRELGYFDSYGSIGTELFIHAANTGKKIAQIPIKTAARNDMPRFGRRLSSNLLIIRALWLAFFQRPRS